MTIRRALIALALVFLLATALEAQPSQKPVVALCADDAENLPRLAEAMGPALTRLTLSEEAGCGTETDPSRTPSYTARFIAGDSGAVFLALVAGDLEGGASRKARVAWLGSAKGALRATLDAGKATALALLLDGLALDFLELDLRALQEKEAAVPPPAPKAVAGDATFATEPAVAAPPRKEAGGRRAGLGLGIAGGAVYQPPSAFAPRIAAEASLELGRAAILACSGASFDSSLEVEGRPFDTFVFFLGLAGRYALVETKRGAVLGEIGAGWYMNRFARADVEAPTTRRWSDLGLEAALVGRIALAGPLGLFARLDAELYPTARYIEIASGPRIRASYVALPLLFGLDLAFGKRRAE